MHKIKWQLFGQMEDLYQSLSFYRFSFERNPQQDMGYGGVNAASILDLLAHRANQIARRNGSPSDEALRMQNQAMYLRKEMEKNIPTWLASVQDSNEQEFWSYITFAEVSFGLGEYEKASEWLNKAGVEQMNEWIQRTLFTQLVRTARLQGIVPPKESDSPSDWHPAWQTLTGIVGEQYAKRAFQAGSGKVGLALSGSGFRASFFHLGVLARLAEMDALRSVEVISTSSGGSMVGAHYYLEAQNLLQTKSDNEITRGGCK